MFTKTNPFNYRTAASAAVAVLLALASSSALASAMASPSGEDDDDVPGKREACAAIGCPGGSRVCGTASGKITSGMPPFVGEIAVSWTCYENPAF